MRNKAAVKDGIVGVPVGDAVFRDTRALKGGGQQNIEVVYKGSPYQAVSFRVKVDRPAETAQERLERANQAWLDVMDGHDQTDFFLPGESAWRLADAIKGMWGKRRE